MNNGGRNLTAMQVLLGALQPDEATVERIMADPQLLAGFDDPAVMAAVADVAAHPPHLAKYASNPKVMRRHGWLVLHAPFVLL